MLLPQVRELLPTSPGLVLSNQGLVLSNPGLDLSTPGLVRNSRRLVKNTSRRVRLGRRGGIITLKKSSNLFGDGPFTRVYIRILFPEKCIHPFT